MMSLDTELIKTPIAQAKPSKGKPVALTNADEQAQTSPQLRRSIVSRTCAPAHHMLRFVLSPDGQVTPDLTRRLPGRGVWLHSSAQEVQKACSANVFRSVWKDCVVHKELGYQIEQALAMRVLNYLHLAKRAGLLSAGLSKTKSAILKHIKLNQAHAIQNSMLLIAKDCKKDGEHNGLKLEKLVSQKACSILYKHEMGQIYNSDQIVYMWVCASSNILSNGLCQALIRETKRLEGFRQEG